MIRCREKPVNCEQFSQWLHRYSQPLAVSKDLKKKPFIMGVLNVTPNSFSDGGLYLKPNDAYLRAEKMIAEGADIIDIGGESTKPGAIPISATEEIDRVIPVIERIRANSDICISIDTSKASVMKAAVTAGASFINDVSALRGEDALFTAQSLNVPVCLMHMKGTPPSMQAHPYYADDVVDEINDFFKERIEASTTAGISCTSIILDPGFGFGKSVKHNLHVIKNLQQFLKHDRPLMLGVSRKSTIGEVLQKEVTSRLSGGIAIAVYAMLQGVAIIRTHDVDETNQALQMIDAIVSSTNLQCFESDKG